MEYIVAVHVYNAKVTQAFSKIPSHVSGSHGHNVTNGCKVLCGVVNVVSLVGVVTHFPVQNAIFIDTHCNWSAAQNWASQRL